MTERPTEPDTKVRIRVIETEQILIAADQLGRLFDISPRSIWRLLDEGKLIKPIRLGGSTRWRLEEVKEWVNRGCPPVTGNKKQKLG